MVRKFGFHREPSTVGFKDNCDNIKFTKWLESWLKTLCSSVTNKVLVKETMKKDLYSPDSIMQLRDHMCITFDAQRQHRNLLISSDWSPAKEVPPPIVALRQMFECTSSIPSEILKLSHICQELEHIEDSATRDRSTSILMSWGKLLRGD
ncbi:460_t:CDS:2 [Ambispora gerdemannii]|uniref:460_t:CDS:1 n=1 Tax=Ambispora gerdemannii TaxID=144530 RepID=A0A9N9C313_9GLOM|nr:460_t:CDS:2 [Ambispora gerdemannii]